MAIYEKYYTDDAGQQYRVAVTYERDAIQRGYYLTIYPVSVTATEYPGMFSVSYTMDAAFFDQRVYTCLERVTRASKKAQQRALDQLEGALGVYFCPRGIAHVGNMEESAAYVESRR